jgi:acetoacetyl-CoA synthetase
MESVNGRTGLHLGSDYKSVWAWSVARPAEFWKAVAKFADVRADWGSGPELENPTQMPGARFFPNAKLNFAENLLRFSDDQPALIFRNERGTRREISYKQLHDLVARADAVARWPVHGANANSPRRRAMAATAQIRLARPRRGEAAANTAATVCL